MSEGKISTDCRLTNDLLVTILFWQVSSNKLRLPFRDKKKKKRNLQFKQQKFLKLLTTPSCAAKQHINLPITTLAGYFDLEGVER